MRDPKRIDEVLTQLGNLWKRYPDWRLTQLFCNMQREARNDMFYVEDDRLVKFMKELEENGF